MKVKRDKIGKFKLGMLGNFKGRLKGVGNKEV